MKGELATQSTLTAQRARIQRRSPRDFLVYVEQPPYHAVVEHGRATRLATR